MLSPPPTLSATPEQETIYGHARGSTSNLMINALAGTGKSHVLKHIQLRSKTRPILYLVFNRKNAVEAKSKMLSTTSVKTINGIGQSIWTTRHPLVDKPNPNKTNQILRDLIRTVKKSLQAPMWDAFDQIISGVALAKALGYVPAGQSPIPPLLTQSSFHSHLDETPDDMVSDLIDAVLIKSISLAKLGQIDYNDQIYMPAIFGGEFPRFPLVMVDEYQDFSPINHLLLSRLVTNRLIGVGDPFQSIYAFRGANPTGMVEATSTYSMVNLPLSISFRCPRAIVEHVHWHVPQFKALKEGGNVRIPQELPIHSLADNPTFICRNNAPLIRLAFHLLSAGHSVSVAGIDIGYRIVALLRKLGPDTLSRAETLSAINDWEAEKLANESKNAADLAACMRIFAHAADSLSSAILYAEHIFAQKTGTILLMTGHKSKGLEFPDVYHLDPYLLSDTSQDRNLRYVISTRSSNNLTEIDSDRIKW